MVNRPAMFLLVGALATGPAFADTLNCVTLDGTTTVEADITFTPDRDGGTVNEVTVTDGDFVLSSNPAKGEGALDYSMIDYNHLEIQLTVPNVGPIGFTLNIVRTAHYVGPVGPDTDIVVAGVIGGVSIGTGIVVCTGW
ncbi:MAG: hypothetical protein JWR75_541 [Devosia sp.]|nr:hypothetical protein [Devosia sp.]